MPKDEIVPFRVHPRIFDALGSELVTNDFVALTELVKNAYDASATKVTVSFKKQTKKVKDLKGRETEVIESWIEVEDDGKGMTKDILRDVWCVIATPYRVEEKYSGNGQKKRRVSGEKGLGRLSASRLGKSLTLITKSENESCWQLELDWEGLRNADDFGKCKIKIEDITDASPFEKSGTRLIINRLNKDWLNSDEDDFDELKEAFSKFKPPELVFNEKETKKDGFEIWLNIFDSGPEEIKLQLPIFLFESPYFIKGSFDGIGKITYTYNYSDEKTKREDSGVEEIIPERVRNSNEDEEDREFFCGPFDFSIKAWDLDSEELLNLNERFNLRKKAGAIRKIIKKYSGISLYRDGILVLPKSDKTSDWLGMNLRRVSDVGARLSSTQVSGQIFIHAEKNSGLLDASNRESLRDNVAVQDFREVISKMLRILERNRNKERNETKKELPLQQLFEQLSTTQMIDEIKQVVKAGKTTKDVLPIIEEYGDKVEKTVGVIERRFVHYSRLATIGVLAAIVMHEIRSKTTIFESFLEKIRKFFDKQNYEWFQKEVSLVDTAIHSLERIADKFTPLAKHGFGKKLRNCFLEVIISESVEMRRQALEKKNIQIEYQQKSKHFLAVDLGDLSAIFLNLLDNAIYWVSEMDKNKRIIKIRTQEILKGERLRIYFEDSGPGISKDYLEKIFYPGVTTRPDGLGMGLTVVAEIVDQYNGTISAVDHGTLNGACFIFDLPLSEREVK